MPPLIKSESGGFKRVSQIISVENLDGLMAAHTEGRDRNLPFGTQIRSLMMLGPLNGAPDAPTASHPLCRFIPRSGCSRRL
jgi:hypothetical protein